MNNHADKSGNRLYCGACGKSVSSVIPHNTIIRAYLECPECIEAKHEITEATLAGWMKEYWKDKGIRKLANMSLYTNGLAHFLKEKGV